MPFNCKSIELRENTYIFDEEKRVYQNQNIIRGRI